MAEKRRVVRSAALQVMRHHLIAVEKPYDASAVPEIEYACKRRIQIQGAMRENDHIGVVYGVEHARQTLRRVSVLT